MAHFQPKLDLAAVLAQPNPRIDLHLQSYETSTRNFLKAVSRYVDRAVSEITKSRDEHLAQLKRIADKTKASEEETYQCKEKEIKLIADLQREQQERQDVETRVATLKRQLDSVENRRDDVDVELKRLRTQVRNLNKEKEGERSLLDGHAACLARELRDCERLLRFRSEGVDVNTLLFRFWGIDPADPERVFSFALDLSTPTYKVLTSSPVLPELRSLEQDLNETRDVYAFLVEVRLAFQASVSEDT